MNKDDKVSPCFSIDDEEIKKKDKLGSMIICKDCKDIHPVKNAKEFIANNLIETEKVQYYTCPVSNNTFLAGIDGRDVT